MSPRAALSGGLDRKLSVMALVPQPSLSRLGSLELPRHRAYTVSHCRSADRMSQVWLTGSLGYSNEGSQVVLNICHVPGS